MSGIIKAGQWQERGTDRHSVAFNLEDVADKAKNWLAEARQQAVGIITRAKHQAIQIEQHAKQQGQETARLEAEAGLQVQLEQRTGTVLPALEQMIQSIQHSRQSWLKHWEQQTVHLAAAIAERVIRRELQQAPEITVDLIRESLELTMGGGRIRIHLNPQDHETLGATLPAILDRVGNLGPVDIIPDPDITAGGCRVVTEFGTVDQQIETQLARIEEELT
ncbi:MAG: FliH/SctL family protein [Pirellulaceae bacterium]